MGPSHGYLKTLKVCVFCIITLVSHGTEGNSIFLINRTVRITVRHSVYNTESYLKDLERYFSFFTMLFLQIRIKQLEPSCVNEFVLQLL